MKAQTRIQKTRTRRPEAEEAEQETRLHDASHEEATQRLLARADELLARIERETSCTPPKSVPLPSSTATR
jgi:hypothetical protein